MKKIFWIILLALVSSISIIPTVRAREDKDYSQFIKMHLSKLTHQMVVEILIEDREFMKYPLHSEKEIRDTLNLMFSGGEVKDIEMLKRKIFDGFDDLNCSFLEELGGSIEYKKKMTLYCITWGLLSNYYGVDNYFGLAWDFYEHIDKIREDPEDPFYQEILDSYFTLRITSLFINCKKDRFKKNLCFSRINDYLIDCCKYFQYIPKKERFLRYIKQLEYIIKECTKVDYQLQPGDTYWSLARYVREKSGLTKEYLKDETLISKLALGIDQDLQYKGISRLEEGEQIELYDAGYYISILIDEESFQ